MWLPNDRLRCLLFPLLPPRSPPACCSFEYSESARDRDRCLPPPSPAAVVVGLDPAPPAVPLVVVRVVPGVRPAAVVAVAAAGGVRAVGADAAGAGDLAAELVDWHRGLARESELR